MTIAEELRAEHEHLLVGVEDLRHAGDLIGMGPDTAAKQAAERAIRFLQDRLLPHAEREEQVLYPAVADLMGSPRSTGTMARDHVEVKALTGRLERAIEESDQPMMRRLLYGLYHVIGLHFAKEEEIYLPPMEQELDPAKTEELARRLHAA